MDEPHAPAPDAKRSDDSGEDARGDATPEEDDARPVEGTIVPPEEMACRARLSELGVRFQTRPPELDDADCPLPFPVSMETLGAGIAIEPAALVNCATAEATARFAQEHVAPLASELLGSGLTTVRQVSGYVCRPRRGTDTISEHATGNAIDFGGFVLEDGREIAASKTQDVKVGRFFARLRHAACGPFKTVLGPGTDADHADHFHFDLAERRNGSTYCR
ncbi:MAG: extensin family protein [Rhizobiaceae bacterium]|nr:extensin family protein [Rhizobiaceae bacterium]MCV0408596.1 extensin family protein [Rhizobiaceae bacterium]